MVSSLVTNVVEGIYVWHIAIVLLKDWGWPINKPITHAISYLSVPQVDPKMLQLTMEQAREVYVYFVYMQ